MSNISSNIPKKGKILFFSQNKHPSLKLSQSYVKMETYMVENKYYNRSKKGKGRIPSRLEIKTKKSSFNPSAFNIDSFLLWLPCIYCNTFLKYSIQSKQEEDKEHEQRSRDTQVKPSSPINVSPHGFCYINITIRCVCLNITYSQKFPKQLLTRDKRKDLNIRSIKRVGKNRKPKQQQKKTVHVCRCASQDLPQHSRPQVSSAA